MLKNVTFEAIIANMNSNFIFEWRENKELINRRFDLKNCTLFGVTLLDTYEYLINITKHGMSK